MRKHWIILSLLSLVAVLAITASFLLSRPQGNALPASVEIVADHIQEAGISPDSSFTVKTGWMVNETQLREMLELDNSATWKLESLGIGRRSRSWRLTPEMPLSQNSIYTVRVKNFSGDVVQSFAFQTISDLLVSRVYPADGETYVPANTGIEFTFNQPDVDIAPYFEIEPPVSGTFKTNGYTATFQPNAGTLFDANSIYRVTLKAGVTSAGGAQLMEDYVFSFETTDRSESEEEQERLRLEGGFAETWLAGDPAAVALFGGEKLDEQEFTISLYQYSSIAQFTETLREYDAFYRDRIGSTRNQYVASKDGLKKISSETMQLIRPSKHGSLYAPLPAGLEEGWYLAEISGSDADGKQQLVQKLVQVRNLSLFTQSADGETLIWLNDPITGEPMSDQKVVLEDTETGERKEGTTDARGTLILQTGKWEKAYLSVMEEDSASYLQKIRLADKEKTPLDERFYTVYYTDRTLYQPTDTIKLWGMIHPRRESDAMPRQVYAILSQGWDQPEIVRVRLKVEENGTFSGELPIDALEQSYYRISISDGEEGNEHLYTSGSLQIRKYTKPPYSINVKSEKSWYYGNEQIKLHVSANYFDGTPVSGGKLEVTTDLRLPNGSTNQTITLDEQGRATIVGEYQNEAARTGELPYWRPDSVWYNLTGVDLQDVTVDFFGYVDVLPSSIAGRVSYENGTLKVQTAKIDPKRLDDSQVSPMPIPGYADDFDRLAGSAIDLPVTVEVMRNEWVETPDGSYYNPILKQTIPRYTYKRESKVVDTLQLTTSGGQSVVSDLKYKDGERVWYTFKMRFAGGLIGDVWAKSWEAMPYNPNKTDWNYQFVPQNSKNALKLGERLELGVYSDGKKLQTGGRVLSSVVQRKMQTLDVWEANAGFPIEMRKDWLPNFVLAGAYFDGRHVYTMESLYLGYDFSEQELNLEIKTDKEMYQPGEQVNVDLALTDSQGKAVEGSAVLSVVDESNFAVGEQEANLLKSLYTRIFHPEICQETSYFADYSGISDGSLQPPITGSGVGNDEGTAEEGPATGGGGENSANVPREIFKDTALFQPVQTDAQGKAQFSFTLPDNIGSWRLTAAAVTNDLKAGNVKTNRIATLPFYLRPLLSQTYLEGDDLAVSLTTGGEQIHSLKDPVQITVSILDADGKQVDQLTGTQKPGEWFHLNFGKYTEGSYTAKFEVRCGQYSDAEKRPFSVVKQALTAELFQTMPLEQISKLESVRYPVQVTIYDKRIDAFMNGVRALSNHGGNRTEQLAAAYQAQVLYNRLMPEEDRTVVWKDERLEQIQEGGTGVRMLPNAPADASTTARMLVAAPNLVNQADAKTYLEGVLADAASTPDDRVMAYVGLAAMRSPILLDLTRMAQQEDLTTAQRLWLGVGLAKLGDFTSAQQIYESVKKQVVTDGEIKYLAGDGTLNSTQLETSAALALTSIISHSDATPLMRYFTQVQGERGESSVLPQLEMLCYLSNFDFPNGEQTTSFTATINGEKQTFTLDAKNVAKSFALSRQDLKNAQFMGVTGNLKAAVRYTGYQQPSLPGESKITIEKTYTPVSGKGQIKKADRVRVDIRVTFAPDAPDGCYSVSDYIPSGMRFMSSAYTQGATPYMSSSLSSEGQQITGYIYRNKAGYEKAQIAENPLQQPDEAQVLEEILVQEEKTNPSTDSMPPKVQTDSCILSYYVHAVTPGNFVIESAFVTPHEDGIAAKSERGTIAIAG